MLPRLFRPVCVDPYCARRKTCSSGSRVALDRPGMKLRYVLLLLAGGLAVWIGLYPSDWQNWLGFSKAAYFTNGQNYAFASGIGPMLLTTLGMSTIISTMFRSLNCHVSGCPRLVKHKIANGEYGVCRKHWHEINGHPADHKFTVEHLRTHHHAHLRAMGHKL